MPKFSRSFSRPSYTRPPVIGAAFVFLLVLCPIIFGAHNFLAFFSLEGLLIVVGGVIAVAFMSFQSRDVHKALDAITALFKEQGGLRDELRRDLKDDMRDIIRWAHMVTDKGTRNLESIGKNNVEDPFVKYGLNMVMSDYTPEDVRMMMETAADACYERESIPIDVLQAMTSHAPAFGMVGTLVGMVIMLCNLDGNVAGMGSALSVSFLSTLYGVISARMVYMPAASKLRHEVEDRRFRNYLVSEGMVLLASKKTPMYIQDRLNSFLRPEIHDYFDFFNANVKHSAATVSHIAPPLLKVANG
jgi:chemotaxis protein MotA